MTIARLSKKPVFLSLSGSAIFDAKFSNDPFKVPVTILSKLANSLAYFIILYSESLISFWELEKYRNKILIAHLHFIDFNTFTITTSLSKRSPIIGHIGRLSGEKGVQHFIQALPTILDDQQNLHVLVGGDGQLKQDIEPFLHEKEISTCVTLSGWSSHEDLPKYLNQLQLLVLPSYTEELPNIMLETMACGTPVGAIPNVIIAGKPGFIQENNSPECIAENVIRALNNPDIERISEKGRKLVEENVTFECAVARWKEVIGEIK